MNPTTQSAFEQIMAAAATAGTAYINAVATREVARVSAPPQDQFAAALSQRVDVGGQSLPVSALLLGGVAIITVVWVLKK